jgi:hypothetical protein
VIAKKSMHDVCLQLFCVCHCKHCWLFYDCKKKYEQCVFATIFACVIATRSYLWLQPDCVYVVKTTWLFCYL